MIDVTSSSSLPPEMPYIQLRAALELFGKPPSQLSLQDREKARQQAAREYAIESRILGAPEAAGVMVSAAEVEHAVAAVRDRYEDHEAFREALEANGLDEAILRLALARQCRVNTVLDRVQADDEAVPISEVDIGIYYHVHFGKFQQPERREAFHILISINEDFPENARSRALERIERIAERLARKPKLFEDLARKNSECPTALQGGRIGLVRRGQLYPELDVVLFELRAGRISGVVESEMGFHLLWCKSILPAETLSLQRATPHIRAQLRERMRESRRRQWIASLDPSDHGRPHR